MAEAPLTFHRTIRASLKSQKIPNMIREPEDPIRYAYEKLLRERDRTKRVYEVDPYAEVYQLRDNIYGIYTESLDGMGDSWIFLIEGPERALLIDTSWGLGNLKGLIQVLIGNKPYFVVNTHYHGDHALGNYQFDTVYCHEYDVPELEKAKHPHVWDRLFDENGNRWCKFPREDLIGYKDYQIISLQDGHTFQLGDSYEVELIHMGGHTAGHSGLLDHRQRILFTGDDCCVGIIGISGMPESVFAEYATVEAFYYALKRITARINEYDSLFPSHGPVETGPVMLFNAMEACEHVLAEPSNYDAVAETERGRQYCRQVHQSGYLRYTAQSVYMHQLALIDREDGL